MTRDEIISGIFIGLFVLLIIAIIWYAIQRASENYEEVVEDTNQEALQRIAEYRTYMVNQWICLLAFWFGIKPEDGQTKLLCPAYNQNSLYFFFENIEIYTFFSWNDNTMEVKTSVFDEDDGYITHTKTFSIANGSLDTEKLFVFIDAVKREHYDYYELNADEVVGVTKKIKMISEDFESEDAAKTYLFDYMADFMILMRRKENRTNRKLLKFYMGFLYWFWNQYGEDFLKYLNMTEEEFSGINENDEEEIEGNE